MAPGSPCGGWLDATRGTRAASTRSRNRTYVRLTSFPRRDGRELIDGPRSGSIFDPDLQLLRDDPRVLLRHHPEPRCLDHPAHGRGDARAVPAHRQAGQGDDAHAAGAAGDQEAPGEVQERPRQAQRRSDEVLPGEQDQPARGLPAAPGADADLLRAVPRHARPLQVHPEGLRPVRGVLHERPTASSTCVQRRRARRSRTRSTSSGWTCRRTPTGVAGGFLDALPYFILVGLVIVTAFAAVPPEPAQRART